AVGTTNGNLGPALLLTGDIENLGGVISITNVAGSLGQGATTYGQQVNIFVPQGIVVVSNPTGTYYAGSNPYSEWMDSSSMIWPGGNPDQGLPDPNTAIAFVANAENPGYSSAGALTAALIGHAGATPDGVHNSSYVYLGDDVPWSINQDGTTAR